MKFQLLCSVAVVLATSAFAFSNGGKINAAIAQRLSKPRYGVRSLKMENFGLGIGEDSYENTPSLILGEANYKRAVADFNPNGLLSRRYPVVSRVQQLKLLTAAADSGLLEALESKGVSLSYIEKLLPVIEKYGLLSFAAKNEEFLINFIAPLAVEPAPLILPVAVSVLKNPGALNFWASILVLSELGVIILSQNVAIDVVAGIPLVGGAVALSVVASILNEVGGTRVPKLRRRG